MFQTNHNVDILTASIIYIQWRRSERQKNVMYI